MKFARSSASLFLPVFLSYCVVGKWQETQRLLPTYLLLILHVSRKDSAVPGTRYRQESDAVGVCVFFFFYGGKLYDVLYSLSELKAVLAWCHDSSPGLNDVSYAFLCHLSDCVVVYLLALYKLISRISDFPSTRSVAVVLPIPKAGKDHLQATYYLPISLTSCICKVTEKMVNERLMWYLKSRNFLTPV